MNAKPIQRDERIIAEENASYRLGFAVLLLGLLALVVLRAVRVADSILENLDLIALMLVSSLVTFAYQRSRKIVTQRWIFIFLCMVCLVLLAALLGLIFLMGRP